MGSNPILSAIFTLQNGFEAPDGAFFLFVSKEFGGGIRTSEIGDTPISGL